MIWAEKTAAHGEAALVQEAFETLFMRLGAPSGMMLVSTKENLPERERLILSLPDPNLLGLFTGFCPLPSEELPRDATLLVAELTEFEKRFAFQANADLGCRVTVSPNA